MKKKLIALLAGALMTVAMAGNALAYFDNQYTLVRVVYDAAGTVEVATDLGTVKGNTVTLTNGGLSSAFNLSMFGPGASLDNLRVAYFAASNADIDVWASGSLVDGISTTTARNFSSLVTATSNNRTYYNGLGGSTGTVIGDKNAEFSYWNKLDKGGATVGWLAAYLTAGNVEMSLADLATIGYVDQGLYFFDAAKTNGSGVLIATLRTLADGTTVLNPSSAVPVPAAVYLLGSGLLGLVGIRRRMS